MPLPGAIDRKFPGAARDWRWQFVFPARRRYRDTATGEWGRHHLDPSAVQRAVADAVKLAGIAKRATCHTFRHSFGTLLKANGEDVKTVQELLRHANSRITLDVYTQAVNSNKRAAQSKVVRMIVSDVGQKVEEKYPQTRP